MKHNFLLLFFTLGILLAGYAQVSINTNGESATECAMLDIASEDRGILFPRVTLSSINDKSPIVGTMQDGLMVFNISTNEELTPGIYVWYDNKWNRANTSNHAFVQGVPVTSYEVSSSSSYFEAYEYCSNLSEGGYTDWRLPSLTEAEILDNAGEFGNMNEFLWTTTPAGEGTAGGRKNMLYRPATDERKLLEISGSHKFRCVR